MNAELALLGIATREGTLNRAVERGVGRHWFVAYPHVWDFYLSHRERYGELPSSDVVNTTLDVGVVDVEGTMDWAIDMLRDQSISYGLRIISGAIDKAIEQGHVSPVKVASQVAERAQRLMADYEEYSDIDVVHDFR